MKVKILLLLLIPVMHLKIAVPFFTLLKTYWPSCSIKMLLTTFEKNFTFKGLDIDCLLTSKNYSYELQWSDNLLIALDEYGKLI